LAATVINEDYYYYNLIAVADAVVKAMMWPRCEE